MEIKLDIVVKDEVLSDIITTAIEGASNYWYFLNEDACDIIHSNSDIASIGYIKFAPTPLDKY